MIRELESKQRARQNIHYAKKELELKQTARTDKDYSRKELESKRRARTDKDYARKELESKQKARRDKDYAQKELESKQKARMDKDYAQKELESKQKARMDKGYAQKELESKQKARTIKDNTQKELESKQKARRDKDYARKELESKQKARMYKDYARKELESNQKARMNKDFARKELESKQKTRTDKDYARKELESKQKARMDPFVLEKERIAKQSSHVDANIKQKEKVIDRYRKSQKRKDPEFQQTENLVSKAKKHGDSIDNCIRLFHESIKVGPQFICTCCDQTWFKQSVSQVSSIKGSYDLQFLNGRLSVDGLEWICTTCKTSLLKNKVPKLSVLNGMCWTLKPKESYLHQLEERLISLRIPFMQVRELPRERQYSVKGNVVNVPVDIQPVVNALPRPFDENVTVAVKLKKKLSYKSCAFTENVRPLRVLVALHWLKRNSTLYKNTEVTIDEDWATRVTRDCEETVKDFFSSEVESPENSNLETSHNTSDESTVYDSDEEQNQLENVGNIDTLVDDADIENRTNMFTFAPGEGQRPLSIYQDTDSEFLCFPTIYCGQRRTENSDRLTPVSYSDIAKWELRSSDRRAAKSVPNIFFKMKKIQMKQLNDKVHLAVRRGQFESKNLTARQAMFKK